MLDRLTSRSLLRWRFIKGRSQIFIIGLHLQRVKLKTAIVQSDMRYSNLLDWKLEPILNCHIDQGLLQMYYTN
ncbi:hypothetical protein M5689_003853 [Euphorbia peplus]|nr:hypothetical protein M5689_003853 [Euphorbia peplus]